MHINLHEKYWNIIQKNRKLQKSIHISSIKEWFIKVDFFTKKCILTLINKHSLSQFNYLQQAAGRISFQFMYLKKEDEVYGSISYYW